MTILRVLLWRVTHMRRYRSAQNTHRELVAAIGRKMQERGARRVELYGPKRRKWRFGDRVFFWIGRW